VTGDESLKTRLLYESAEPVAKHGALPGNQNAASGVVEEKRRLSDKLRFEGERVYREDNQGSVTTLKQDRGVTYLAGRIKASPYP
jgi:hypothetical protein